MLKSYRQPRSGKRHLQNTFHHISAKDGLLPKLREEVLEANLELVRRVLVCLPWNFQRHFRYDSLLVIKPRVPYKR